MTRPFNLRILIYPQSRRINVSASGRRVFLCFPALALLDVCILICILSPHPSLNLFFSPPSLQCTLFQNTFPPPGSQAPKYRDWCRQLRLITNGERSRAAAAAVSMSKDVLGLHRQSTPSKQLKRKGKAGREHQICGDKTGKSRLMPAECWGFSY